MPYLHCCYLFEFVCQVVFFVIFTNEIIRIQSSRWTNSSTWLIFCSFSTDLLEIVVVVVVGNASRHWPFGPRNWAVIWSSSIAMLPKAKRRSMAARIVLLQSTYIIHPGLIWVHKFLIDQLIVLFYTMHYCIN